MKEVKVQVTFEEEALGTASNDPDLQRTYIASQAPDAPSKEEEVAALGVDAVAEKGITVFPKEDGVPFIWDYQVKGFLKDACSSLSRVPDTRSSKIKAYKKVIDGLIFPAPRKIMLRMPEGAKIGRCNRPLRAATAQGERVAIAAAETVPAGTSFTTSIKLLDEKLEPFLTELLDYGALRGMCQWRNSGKGRFTWKLVK